MKNSRKIEILKGMIQTLKEDSSHVRGICLTIVQNSHTLEESKEIYRFIQSNKPFLYRHPLFYDPNRSTYWWTRDEKGKKQRILFLEMLIKELNKSLPWYTKLFNWFR